jgi:hypothetical protein
MPASFSLASEKEDTWARVGRVLGIGLSAVNLDRLYHGGYERWAPSFPWCHPEP